MSEKTLGFLGMFLLFDPVTRKGSIKDRNKLSDKLKLCASKCVFSFFFLFPQVRICARQNHVKMAELAPTPKMATLVSALVGGLGQTARKVTKQDTVEPPVSDHP